jgi:hypothetical protein
MVYFVVRMVYSLYMETYNMIETHGIANRDFIVKCLNLFAELLEIKLPNLSIYIDDTMEQTGQCYQNSDDDYMIFLKAREEGNMIQTLAHEMVHVKQFLKDDLASHFCFDVPYSERWWEIEAYSKEKDLMKDLIQKVKAGVITA